MSNTTSTSSIIWTSADEALFNELMTPTTPLEPREYQTMQISTQIPDNTIRLRDATLWLTRILDSPTLSGVDLPGTIKGYIYIDRVPHNLHYGTWTMDGTTLYLARSAANIEPLTRLAILACIANMTGANENPVIAEKLSTRLVQAVSESVRSVYNGLVTSINKPSRLAIDHVNCRVAAEMNGAWFTTSGVPVEVDSTWIVMDF